MGFPERAPGYIPHGPCVRRPSAGKQSKADMDNLARVRRASMQVAKVQRRFWLLQTIFWPTVVAAGGLIAAVAVGSFLRRRRNTVAETHDARLSAPSTTTPTEVRLNGASSGNLSG